MPKRTPIAVELFSGCGGMSTGLLDSGIFVAGGFDSNSRSIDAYNYNHEHRGSRGFVRDVALLSGSEILALTGVKRVDLLAGGPPCQPFSIAGKRRGSDDSRSSLIEHYLRLVGELKPQAILFENVPNLENVDNGDIYAHLLRSLRARGYSVTARAVKAADYGVAQVRRRLLIIGVRDALTVLFPPATHGPSPNLLGLKLYVSASEAIGDLPSPGPFEETGVYNHEATLHSEAMLKRFESLRVGSRERGSFHDRLHPDRPSYTLRAGSGNFSPLRPVHYADHRVITVRESARLQGFIDSFIWPDWIPRLQQYRQVGNAVPPPLARAFGEAIAAQLGWHLEPQAFRGDASTRPAAITMTGSERRAAQESRIRGASLGRESCLAKKGA